MSERFYLASFAAVLILPASAFPVLPKNRNPHPQVVHVEQEIIEEESNFWVSVRQRNPDQSWDARRKPHFQNLDSDGVLPDACYTRLGDPSHEPKPTCLISIDLRDTTLDDDVLSYVHKCIDSGFTTIQGGTPYCYRFLKEQTPQTVLSQVNLISSLRVPTLLAGNPRDVILRSLHEMGGPCIDTLQLQHNPQSPYFLDLLDVATDLQREGLIRSIVGSYVSPKLMRQVHESGFFLETNQIPMNLLDPCRNYNSDTLLAAKDTDTFLVLDNPHAGGLLSDRYHSRREKEPYMYELTPSERHHLFSLYEWSDRHAKKTTRTKKHRKETTPWLVYQSEMMNVLYQIAIKHGVSMEAVVLRWTLQQDQVSRVVVPCDLKGTNSNHHHHMEMEQVLLQPQRLRCVFSFDLDQDDVNDLWDASGCTSPSTTML